MTLESGKLLGNRYRIIEKIGEGALATVYLSKDQLYREIVALKVLENVRRRQKFASRFRREAKTLSQLKDAHIVRIFDFGVDGDLVFIVMEYAPGWTVAELISKKGPMPVREALDIIKQAAQGLAVAWRKRIAHLDIKPQNLMVDADGFVRIMDFGLATTAEDLELSDTGFLGKPHYVSPEQIEDEEPDVRADIYSLGAVLHEMLTGRILFDGDSPLEIANKHLRDSVPPVCTYRPDIPPLVEQLVAKCLEKKPADRFKTPRGLIRAIDKVMDTLPRERGQGPVAPPSPAAYAAVLESASGREYRLPADKRLISIGRKSKKSIPDVDLSAENAARYVSRRHAKFSREGNQWFITLEPEVPGPTYVNKSKLTPGQRVPLKDGDRLRLAKVELTFRLKGG